MPSLGQRVRKLREDRGWSLDRLASESDLSRAYLWKLETKRAANPSLDTLEKLATAFQVSIGELSGSLPETGPVPPSLRDMQNTHNVPDSDIQELNRIRFRGGQPTKADDWYLLYVHLKRARGIEK